MRSTCCYKCERKDVRLDFNCHDDSKYCPEFAAEKEKTKLINDNKHKEMDSLYKSENYIKKIGRI